MDIHNPGGFSEGIGMALAHSTDDGDCRYLYVEWAIDHWAAIELRRYIPVFDKCFKDMTTRPITYNDLDNTSWKVKWEGAQAIALETQNVNYLYVRKPAKGSGNETLDIMNIAMGKDQGEFHIYRYWKVMPEDPYGHGPEHWADDDAKYGPSRPSLNWLVEHKGTTYNDLRDEAWIASESGFFGRSGGMIDRYHYFKYALFYLDTLVYALEEGDE